MPTFKLSKSNPMNYVINFLLVGAIFFVLQLLYPHPYFWAILFFAVIIIESIAIIFTNKKVLIEITNKDIRYTGLFGKTTIKFKTISDIYKRKRYLIGDIPPATTKEIGIYIEAKNQDTITIEEVRFEKDYLKIKHALEKAIKKQIKFKTNP